MSGHACISRQVRVLHRENAQFQVWTKFDKTRLILAVVHPYDVWIFRKNFMLKLRIILAENVDKVTNTG